MVRTGAYGFIWFFTVCLLIPYKSTAHPEKRDTVYLAEDEIIEPGDYDYIIPSEALSGTIPFTRAGNLIVIQVQIDSVKGNFILDTGAPGLVLNLTYFRNYQASNRADPEAGGITGGVAGGSPTMVKYMSLGNFTYSSINADRVSLGHIENSKNLKILGLLGTGLFKRFEMLIDYANEVIYLHRVAKSERTTFKGLYQAQKEEYYTFPISTHDGRIMTRLLMGNQKLNFVLDTGAETNIMDSRLGKDVYSNVVMERKITLVGAGAQKVEAWYGRVKEAYLGPCRVENMAVLVTSLKHMSAAFGKDIDGMLGYEFFSRQKVVINFPGNEMYIWK